MAVEVKVELDDQEARQDLKELESEKHKIKLDIEGSYEDILCFTHLSRITYVHHSTM